MVNDSYSKKERQFVAGELVGHRLFRISPNLDRTLEGPYTHLPWEPGINAAKCIRTEAQVVVRPVTSPINWSLPATADPTAEIVIEMKRETVIIPRCLGAFTKECDCGFYGMFNYSDVLPGPQHMIGSIKGWGRVVVGDKGFRAQYAQVIALYTDFGPSVPTMVAIAERYEVPLSHNYREFIDKFPATQWVP